MNTVSFSVRTALLVLGLGLLSACGGGGGGGGNGGTPSTHSMSGVVVDPAIAGATVTLRSASGNALAAVVTTDGEGRFTINYPAGSDLNGAVLTSRGGEDVVTGYSFRNAVLSAPVTEGEPVVSLLTSLVQYLIEEDGLSAEAATQTVAGWYSLSDAAVLADPRDSAAAQYSALHLAGWLNALRDEEAPVALIAGALRAANGDLLMARQQLIDDARAASTADNFALLAEMEQQFDASGAADAEQMAERFTLANLRVGMAHHINEYIGALNLDDPVTAANFDALVQAVWDANGRRGVPLDSARVVNLIRYALTEGEIGLADLSDEQFVVPALSSDRIASITAARDAIDHTLPLAPGEFLGSDNARRLAYFYASDLSPFYRAERIFDGIMDDNVLDPLYLHIAEGQARVGLTDQAIVTLDTKIFQAAQRLDAMRLIGYGLGVAGRHEDATDFFARAVEQVNRIIDAKGGPGFIDRDEVQLLVKLQFSANGVGQSSAAEAVLEPLYIFAEINAGNTEVRTLYGRVISALGNAAGAGPVPEAVAAYERGAMSLQEARDLVAIYRTIVLGNPPLANGSQLVKGMYLAYTADYEDRLGLDPWPTIAEFQALESQGNNLDSYVNVLADVYGRHDRIDEYVERAQAISSSSRRAAALKAIATWQALAAFEQGDDLGEVIAGLVADAESLTGQLDRLLWVGSNTGNPGLGLALHEQGLPEGAAQVIEYAAALVSSEAWQAEYADQPANLVRQGCDKIADAWYRIDNLSAAQQAADACRLFIADYDWSTVDNRFIAYGLLADGVLIDMGDETRLATVAGAMYPLITSLQSSSVMGGYGTVAEFAALAGQDALLGDALTGAMGRLPARPFPTAQAQDERFSALNTVALGMIQLLSARDRLRTRIAVDGVPGADRLTLLAWINDEIEAQFNTDLPLVDEALALNSSEQRADMVTILAELLARAGWADDAVQAANRLQYKPDRDAALGVVAERIVLHSDFPGSIYASRDLDGDGKPDFFDPVDDEAGGNPFQLDDDLDGDGCPDSQDRRPFFATDGLTDCAA